MAKIVIALYDYFEDARAAVQDLAAVFQPADISLIAGHSQANWTSNEAAASSGLEKSGLEILLGIPEALSLIPGMRPYLAAGPLVTTLNEAGSGAATNGLLGALTRAGVPHQDARNYVEGVRLGGSLVTVHAADEMANPAVDLLNLHHSVDVDRRAENWRNEGGAPMVQETFSESALEQDA